MKVSFTDAYAAGLTNAMIALPLLLSSVTVSREVPPGAIEAGANDFVAVGAAAAGAFIVTPRMRS